MGIKMKKTVLLVTDFYYQAKGREYYREDVLLSGLLRSHFNVVLSHIEDCEKLLNVVDAVLLRNTGPQSTHRNTLSKLKKRTDLALYNDLLGKGDIVGKHHLLELFDLRFPVIPTYSTNDKALGTFDRYLLKPLNGADSAGVMVVSKQRLQDYILRVNDMVVQPLVDFVYEVSFYFVGKQFQYALYAPDNEKRWELQQYSPTHKDLEFALLFINWNTCVHGIQRVDACRTKDGELLLMELEDYNPFLSLELLNVKSSDAFVTALANDLEQCIDSKLRQSQIVQ